MGLAMPEVTGVRQNRTELQRRSSEESLSELLGGVNTRSGSILGLAEGTRDGWEYVCLVWVSTVLIINI